MSAARRAAAEAVDRLAETIARRELGQPPRTTPEEPAPDGLYYPAPYVLETFDLWYRSDFQTYPNGKAYDEQDPQLLADYAYLLRLVDFHLWRLHKPAEPGGKRRSSGGSARAHMAFEEL